MKNIKRASLGRAALTAHALVAGNQLTGREEAESALIDLLCDLRHLAAAEGLPWNAINRIAKEHFAEERAGRE